MIKFHFTRYPSDAVIEPALRTLRNIVYGDDAQTQLERTMYYYLVVLVKSCLS